MTKKELNRDVKKLAKDILAVSQKAESTGDSDPYYTYMDTEAKTEFTRLFHADKDFTYMDRTSILIMLRLNVRHRFIALHQFGLNIDLDKLI